MRLKLGRLCNSLGSLSSSRASMPNLCSCCCFCSNRSRLKGATNGSNKKTSLKYNLRLIYYTFFYNQNNDTLTTLETLLTPCVSLMTSFIRYLGMVGLDDYHINVKANCSYILALLQLTNIKVFGYFCVDSIAQYGICILQHNFTANL